MTQDDSRPDPLIPSDPLLALGFTSRWQAVFSCHGEAGLEPGRVVKSDRGLPLVATRDSLVRAEPSNRLRRATTDPTGLPATGDWVALDLTPSLDVALIEVVLPRTSAFIRGDSGGSSRNQVIAANVDTVFIVHSVEPAPNLRRIERELALTWESGAVPVVVLTKADLSGDGEALRTLAETVAVGVDVHLTSAVTGWGLDALQAYAEGHRSVALIGPSGAGKSTLVNALVGEERQATREVRHGDGKGRHTTVAREIIPLPNGGVLIDTPGMRALALTDLDGGIASTFPDVEALTERCRFRDCSHEREPGCAVLAALGEGTLAPERLESYRKLMREARSAAIRADARLRAEREREWRTIHKEFRRHYRDKGRG